MAIIDRDGLFKGKRLRRCSTHARLYWPYFFLMSNGYARVELDFEALADEFASFRDAAPSPDEIRSFFEEYEANHLIFVYQVEGQQWAQWDTRRSHTKDFKTASDRSTPHPPEAEYRAWLQKQYGEGWRPYHWNCKVGGDDQQPGENTHKPSRDSADILPTVAQHLPKSYATLTQSLPLGVGVGVGDGDGKELSQAKAEREITYQPEEPTDLDIKVMEVWEAYPTASSKKRAPGQADQQAIAEAIVQDGFDAVIAGTRNYRDAVEKWPEAEKKFIRPASRFFGGAEPDYLKNPAVWDKTVQTGKPSAKPSPWGGNPADRLREELGIPTKCH